MASSASKVSIMYWVGFGIISGVLFTLIVGHINIATYIFDQLGIGLFEIPLIISFAVFVRKFGWKKGGICAVFGAGISAAILFPEKSITPVVFLSVSLMGVILGETSWFKGSFLNRLIAVSLPGLIIAFVLGVPLVTHGVSPETMDNVRQDSLEMYQNFMSQDEALNATENVMHVFRGIIKAGLALLFVSSLTVAWLSFLCAQWVMKKFHEVPEYVSSLSKFKIPFHAIWVFLGSFGLLLSEYKPVFPLALNIFAMIAFLYLIQGIAIVIFQMNRLSMGRLPRVLFWCIFFVTFVFSGIFLIGAGLIDNWFSLRSFPSNNTNK